jgi:hypothetical protein
MTEINGPSNDSSDDRTEALEDFPSATAGPGEFLSVTADKKADHEDLVAAERALEEHESVGDVAAALEEFPSATAGPGEFLAMTADHPDHKSH